MNIVYVVLVRDRHVDSYIEIYRTKEQAIEAAWNLAREFSRGGSEEDWEEYEDIKSPYVFSMGYSCEGDCVSVLEREILDK
jgi:hypothetical protein